VAWGVGPGGQTAQQFAASVSTILGNGVILSTETEVTIVRLRGAFSAYLRSATAADNGFHCALGVGIASEDAFAVGVTALPNPLDDADWPGWFYHRFFDIHASGAFAGDQPGGSVAFEVDSKAMRKMGENEIVFANLQVIEDSAATMTVWFDSRLLAKLH